MIAESEKDNIPAMNVPIIASLTSKVQVSSAKIPVLPHMPCADSKVNQRTNRTRSINNVSNPLVLQVVLLLKLLLTRRQCIYLPNLPRRKPLRRQSGNHSGMVTKGQISTRYVNLIGKVQHGHPGQTQRLCGRHRRHHQPRRPRIRQHGPLNVPTYSCPGIPVCSSALRLPSENNRTKAACKSRAVIFI